MTLGGDRWTRRLRGAGGPHRFNNNNNNNHIIL